MPLTAIALVRLGTLSLPCHSVTQRFALRGGGVLSNRQVLLAQHGLSLLVLLASFFWWAGGSTPAATQPRVFSLAILGTTLLLIFGVAPASIGLAYGLLIQSAFFEQQDLPQYGMNITTLRVPLFATAALARRIIPESLAYVDISYRQAFKLSVAFQGGIVVWVGFWAFYGRGFGVDNLSCIASFGAAYMTVVLVEPLIDLGLLAAAKLLHRLKGTMIVDKRLYSAA